MNALVFDQSIFFCPRFKKDIYFIDNSGLKKLLKIRLQFY
jgi:hypothetical protein